MIALSGCTITDDIGDNYFYDPILVAAEPYISKIEFENIGLRKEASTIVNECSSGDNECYVNELYRHVVENYKYYSDPRSREFIQAPYETIDVKGGDCEDLTILLNSLLENIGIKTYMVLTDDHAYTLACGIDTDKLFEFIKNDLIDEYVAELSKASDAVFTIEDGKIYIASLVSESFALEAGSVYYHGGDGSALGTTKS